MPPHIEPLERRQLCRAPSGVAPAAFAPPDSALLQWTIIDVFPTPGTAPDPPPQPQYTEIKRYTGSIGRGRRSGYPVEVVQLYQAGALVGTRFRFVGRPDGEFTAEVQTRGRRFVMKASRVEPTGEIGTHSRTIEFRGRIKRNGQLVTAPTAGRSPTSPATAPSRPMTAAASRSASRRSPRPRRCALDRVDYTDRGVPPTRRGQRSAAPDRTGRCGRLALTLGRRAAAVVSFTEPHLAIESR